MSVKFFSFHLLWKWWRGSFQSFVWAVPGEMSRFFAPKTQPLLHQLGSLFSSHHVHIHRIRVLWSRVKVEFPQTLFLRFPVAGRQMGPSSFGNHSLHLKEVVLESDCPFVPLIEGGGRVLKHKDVLLKGDGKSFSEIFDYCLVLRQFGFGYEHLELHYVFFY